MPPPSTANDGVAAGRNDAVDPMESAGATEAEADALSASAPLSGPIRLPRPRPYDVGMVRAAYTTLSNVPLPRPRPPRPAPVVQERTTTNGQLEPHPEASSHGNDSEVHGQ